MVKLLNELIANSDNTHADTSAIDEVLSHILRGLRLSSCMQFSVMPVGAWQIEASSSLAVRMGGPADAMIFHVVLDGSCWLKMDGHESLIGAGEVVAFPFGCGHRIGVGSGGRLLDPVTDLPPRPWREVPRLKSESAQTIAHLAEDRRPGVRMLCGFLWCEAMQFEPLRASLPSLLHIRTRPGDEAHWLRAAILQIASEVDSPRCGGVSMLERLTEVIFLELLRHQILKMPVGSEGWLAALADRALGKCLALIHKDPQRDWSLQELAVASGLSRSGLAERFDAMLNTSPMRYVRDWRLNLASVAIRTTSKPIMQIAYEAGYGTEAAFSRAFSRIYGDPPATWRQKAEFDKNKNQNQNLGMTA